MALVSSALDLSLSTLTLWYVFVRARVASAVVNHYRPLSINEEIMTRNERVARCRGAIMKMLTS